MIPLHLCQFARGPPKRHSRGDRISPPIDPVRSKGDPARTAPHPPAGKPISRRSPPAAYSFTTHPFGQRRGRRYSCRPRRLAIKHDGSWNGEGAMRFLAAWVMLRSLALIVTIGFAVLFGGNAPAQTLKAGKEGGAVALSVSQGVIGFSARSEDKDWTGIDADFCRALAAAIFDDASKVEFIPLSADDRFQALQSKKIDVLSRNSTWTMARETELGLLFAGVNFYDGQGFLVRHARNVTSALELKRAKVCVQSGTTTELNLRDYFAANGMPYEAIATATAEEALAGYVAGRC